MLAIVIRIKAQILIITYKALYNLCFQLCGLGEATDPLHH